MMGLNGKDIFFIFIVATIPIKEYTYIGFVYRLEENHGLHNNGRDVKNMGYFIKKNISFV